MRATRDGGVLVIDARAHDEYAGVETHARRAGHIPGAVNVPYRSLLRDHIEKEEQVLFPMAEQMVSGKQAADLASRFDAIEREQVGAGKHEEYHAMLERLRATYGV